jgi:hypothetical protein
VFRYFLEWLKLEIAPKHYMAWLDDHVHAYYAVGLSLSLYPDEHLLNGALLYTLFVE